MTDEIRTVRLLLRRWRDDDRAPFADLNADPEVMKYFPAVLSAAESDALVNRIEAHFATHGYGLWALEAGGQFIGFTGLSWATWPSDFTPALEIGWRLAVPAWGRGYASEAAIAAVRHGLGHERSIVSFTATRNEPSQRVMRRIGLRLEGEFDHPRLTERHPLRRHVLYRADRETWAPPRVASEQH